jgi:hypothetical protein
VSVHHYFMNGERVTTELHGDGTVIRDLRIPEPLVGPCDRVWVRLDAGENPVRFRSSDLELLVA